MAAIEAQGLEKRDYFRVQTQLPLRAQVISAGERSRLEREIYAGETGDLGDVDPQLAAWMDRLEVKLDRILEILGEDRQELRPSEVHDVVISGSGISWVTQDPVAHDATLLLEFELPGPPAQRVRCLGVVVRTIPRDDGSEVACGFSAIREEDRESIIRHCLDVERFALRSRSTARDDA
ncbi:MAG: PilZ domain-containing protein [Myxococcota bacterium]